MYDMSVVVRPWQDDGYMIPAPPSSLLAQQDAFNFRPDLLFLDGMADGRKAYRPVSDNLGTDIDMPGCKVDERIFPEMVVVVMAVDYPGAGYERYIGGVVDQREPDPLENKRFLPFCRG